MKLCERTISLLKSFSNINQSILIRKGDKLTTASTLKTIVAEAKIDESFDKDVAIYELSRFLGVVSLFEDPDYDFQDTHVVVTSGQQQVRYIYADPDSIVAGPEDGVNIGDPDIEFFLDVSDLTNVMKASSVMGLPEIAVVGEDGKIFVRAFNSQDPAADNFSVEVGKTEDTFKMIFKPDNLKLISRNYDVRITSRGIAEFDGTDVKYWIATEASSEYKKG